MTALLLIAGAGVVLLALGSYSNTVLTEYALGAQQQALERQALLAAEYLDTGDQSPMDAVRWLSALTGTRTLLFDADGAPIADSAGPEAEPRADKLYVSPFKGNELEDGILRLSAALDDGTAVVLAAPAARAVASRQKARAFLLGAFAVLAALGLAIAAWGWRSVDEEADRVTRVATRLRSGDLSARVGEVRVGPLGGLAAQVNGAVEHLVGLLVDARGQSRYYGAILDQMTDAVVAIDERGRVQFINHAFARLFGAEPDDARERPLENVTLNYDLSALVTRAIEQRTTQRASLRLTHPADRMLECVATPLTDEQGQAIGAVALLHDLTQVREADRVRQDFVANAGHELRTPAASIKALAEALQAGALTDPKRGPEFAKQIVDAADRLTEILDDMLTLTRVERGAQLLEPMMVDACTALEDAVNMVRPAARLKGISVSTECAQGEQAYADQASLQTLLVNLLDNAVKYTPANGSVLARGRSVPGGYELAVSDTGVGIPAEHQERIFERFYRADRARDRATGGTGLGLSIVRHIAQAHGGRVTVSSQEGKGSTFTAFFPEA